MKPLRILDSDPTPRPLIEKLSAIIDELDKVRNHFKDEAGVEDALTDGSFLTSCVADDLLMTVYNYLIHIASDADIGKTFSAIGALLASVPAKERTILLSTILFATRSAGMSDVTDEEIDPRDYAFRGGDPEDNGPKNVH